MPIAFALPLAASLGIHLAALFGTDVELFGGVDEPMPPLRAELQPLPAAPVAAPRPVDKKVVAKPRPKPPKPRRLASITPAPNAESVPPMP